MKIQPRNRGRMAAIGALAGIGAAGAYATSRRRRRAARTAGADQTTGVRAAVTVRRSPEEVYAFWRDVENLSRFTAHLEAVRAAGERLSHWTAKAPAGRTVEWDAEIVEDRPGELIAWRSCEGAQVDNSGTVRFAPAPGERGTEVHVDMTYAPPGGPVGQIVAKLFGEEPQQQVRNDLRRLKQVLETGTVVRSEGTPEGPVTRRMLTQRPAQPPVGAVDGGSGS